MTPEAMQRECDAHEAQGLSSVVLVVRGPYPKRFIRGELLCVNSASERVYRFDIAKVRKWLARLK